MSDPFSLIAGLPLAVLGVGAIIYLALELAGLLKDPFRATAFALFVLIASGCFFTPYLSLKTVTLSGMMIVDGFGGILSIVLLVAAGAVILLNHRSLLAQRVLKNRDINTLILLSTAGALALVSANDLITAFLGLELLSIPVYVLVASAREEKAATEGALKYFLLGALSSCFLLFGMSLLYAATGTLQIVEMAGRLQGDLVVHPMVLMALALIGAGFAFKVSLAPFHFWTPDAYQGAPISVLAYMAVVVKTAAFGAMVRVFNVAFGSFSSEWTGYVVLLGGISMLVGNLSALRQTSIKRLVAYSSVAHAGYAVVALPFAQVGGIEAVLFYVMTYAITSLGLIAVLLFQLGGTNAQYHSDSLESLKGLYGRDRIAALALVLFLLSLAGIPPLAGFFGKFFVITTVIRGGYPGIAVFLVINSVLSLFYYLKVAALAFEPGEEVQRESFSSFPSRLVFVLSAVVVLGSAVFVDPLSHTAASASEALLAPVMESAAF